MAMTFFTWRRCVGPIGIVPVVPFLLVALGAASGLQDDKPGWINLLAGGDLSKHWTTTGNWKLEKDGAVALEPRPGEKGWQRYDAYLWSKKQYKDFEADFE